LSDNSNIKEDPDGHDSLGAEWVSLQDIHDEKVQVPNISKKGSVVIVEYVIFLYTNLIEKIQSYYLRFSVFRKNYSKEISRESS